MCVQVVIAGSEFEAVAVHQATQVPAVALPSGTLSLPPEVSVCVCDACIKRRRRVCVMVPLLQVLPQLEQFERVYLWLGKEATARQAASHFARKLGPDRCHLVW